MKKKTVVLMIVGFVIFSVVTGILFGNREVETNFSSKEELLPVYTVVNNSKYIRDEKECIAYRITTVNDITDEQLLSIYDVVCKDEYYLHTVWFYKENSSVDDAYDLAMIEQTKENEQPTIKRK